MEVNVVTIEDGDVVLIQSLLPNGEHMTHEHVQELTNQWNRGRERGLILVDSCIQVTVLKGLKRVRP